MNTIIEKIRAEVLRRKKRNKEEYGGNGLFEVQDNLDTLLSFLSDLEKECEGKPTTAEGLELKKEIDIYFKDWDTNSNGAFFNEDGYKIDTIALKNIARHFYELGQQSKPKVCEELEEEHLNPFKFVAGCIDDTLKEKAKEVSANEIEDEINRWMGSTDCLPEDVGITPLPKVMEIVERTARHFAKWGAEHRGSSETPKNLEEAAENYEQTRNDLDAISDNEIVRRAFIAGAKWDREQFMKDAVEGEVVKDISNKLAVTAKINLDGFKFGDKVRIIVIPNTDEK